MAVLQAFNLLNILTKISLGKFHKSEIKKDPCKADKFKEENGKLKVLLHTKISAIARGQLAVFYEGNYVTGGRYIV